MCVPVCAHVQVRVNLGWCSLNAVYLVFCVRVPHCPGSSLTTQLEVQWITEVRAITPGLFIWVLESQTFTFA